MPTTKKRINVTLADSLIEFLELAARRDNVPVATKAAELIKMAMEIEEDAYWSKVADQRANEKVKYIPYNEKMWDV